MTSQMEKIKVLIVDDHQIVRQGLRTFLELHQDIVVVGEAGDGLSAVEMSRQYEPQVVLMDLVMPQMDGIEATRKIKTVNEKIKIIALTSFIEDDMVMPAIQAGASSYLLKDVTPDNLVDAIRATYRGEARLSQSVTGKLMEQIARQPGVAHEASDAAIYLTAREYDVIRLVGQGLGNQEIAETLFISDKTAKTHVSNILRKLNLTDRTQLAIYAIRNNLV